MEVLIQLLKPPIITNIMIVVLVAYNVRYLRNLVTFF